MKQKFGPFVTEIIAFLLFFTIIVVLVIVFQKTVLGEETRYSNAVECGISEQTIEDTETQADDSTPEITLNMPIEPTNTFTPEPTPEPTPWNISVAISTEDKSYKVGDRVVFISSITGAEGLTCEYQWQQEINGTWIDVDGDSETFSFILTELNKDCLWRLAVTVSDQK